MNCEEDCSVTFVPGAQTFVCKDAKPIDSLSMIWDGPNDVNVVSPTGDRVDGVVNGQEVSFNGLSGRGNDVFWVIDGAGLSGASRFHACPFSSGGPVFNGCRKLIGKTVAGFSAAMPVRKNIVCDTNSGWPGRLEDQGILRSASAGDISSLTSIYFRSL